MGERLVPSNGKRLILSKNGEVLAWVVNLRNIGNPKSTLFLSEPTEQLQMGLVAAKSDGIIRRHTHPSNPRKLDATVEVLIVLRGSVACELFDEEKELVEAFTLSSGSLIYLARGGHGFKLSKRAKVIEIKQGPFIATLDKEFF